MRQQFRCSLLILSWKLATKIVVDLCCIVIMGPKMGCVISRVGYHSFFASCVICKFADSE